jgi:hypothetical protein
MSNVPHGWTKAGNVWSGTSGDSNSGSVLTMTQYPQLTTCLGMTPPLTVTAAEATSPVFASADTSTDVYDVADVYHDSTDAKSDFPPFHNSKLPNCLLQAQGSSVLSLEKSLWDSATTFGTMSASLVNAPKFGDQSGMLMIQVPVHPSQALGGGSLIDYNTLLVIRQGRSTAELYITQSGAPPSASLTQSLAQAVVAKMKAPSPH